MPVLIAWINSLSPEQVASELTKAKAENAVNHT